MTTTDRNRQAAMLIWSSLIGTAVLLCSRRWTGAINEVSSPWPCVLVSSVSVLLSGLGWISFQQSPVARSPRSARVAVVVAWLPTWLGGLALLPSDSPIARGWLLGIAALSGVGLLVTQCTLPALARKETDAQRVRVPDDHTRTTGRPDVSVQATDAPADLTVFDPVTDERSREATIQWMTRQLLPKGVDQIEGAIRVTFAAGQRAASVHVPFSPPFADVPRVECDTIGDEPVRWKLSVVYAYGMRVELKRETNNEPGEVELSYVAVCQSVAEAA